MNYEFLIALRYLRAKKKTGFISLTTYISIGGVMLGVAALIIALSLLNGFEREIRSRMIGFDAYIKIEKKGENPLVYTPELEKKLHGLTGVVGISPYILQKALVSVEGGQSVVFVKGIDVRTVGDVTDLPKNVTHGDLSLEESKGLPGIIIGRSLYERHPVKLLDAVPITSPLGMTNMFSVPPVKRFQMRGVFQTDLYDYDNWYVFIPVSSAQKLFRMKNAVTGIDIKTTDFDNAEMVAGDIKQLLGDDYNVLTWYDLHRDLFSAMKIEKRAALIILSLIIAVAAFNIVSTLIMVVMEKTREIGILKSMGSTSASITKIFMFEGLIVGIFGILTGLIIGYGVCWTQQTYQFISLPSDVFIIDAVPIAMEFSDFLQITFTAIFLCIGATLYPARKAASLIPVEAIRSQ